MNRRYAQDGFALPSIIITSLVMFTLVTAIVGTVSSIKVALDTQYYRALARDAAESGANYAKICLYEPSFAVGDTIDPTKTCKKVSGSYTSSGKADRWLINNSTASGSTKFRTTYDAKLVESNSDGKRMAVTGKVELLRTSDSSVWRTYTWVTNAQMTKKIDPEGDRASKQFWYFGQFAGLDFGKSGSNDPTPLAYNLNPSVPNPYGANEGATVTNDQNGNFLFWSNGLQIWNKAGVYMSDVAGPGGLKGHDSVSQGGVSMPLNTARTQYAVVTNTAVWEGYNWNGTPATAYPGAGELYMHIIDMTRDGGNGAIIKKNIPLSQSSPLATAYSGEAIGAMPNTDGSGYYVYTFLTAPGGVVKISSFLIKLDGSISDERHYNLPGVTDQLICRSPHNNDIYGFGTINFNPSYSKMILSAGAFNCSGVGASWASPGNNGDYRSGKVYLLTPNRATGDISLQAHWFVNNNYQPYTANYPATIQYVRQGLYEAEFSPSEKYVYTTTKFPGRLNRYDISSMNSTTIQNSEWCVPTTLTRVTDSIEETEDIRSGGHIRTGPNGKVYIADPAYSAARSDGSLRPGPYRMSVINKPDATTNSISSDGIDLSIDDPALAFPMIPGTSLYAQTGQSLPQMVTVYVPEIIIY